MSFEITELRSNTVWQLYRMRERILLDPEYQRLGGIWAPDNRQLLVDTILNGFDVPKLYLHKFGKPFQKGTKSYDFAIVDGKQRLETIWAFIDGKIALADDFEFFKDAKVKPSGMTYNDLGLHYPELKADFDGFPLTVILIETDDIEMIEEMFSRLNEAAPLTAAEKRNAYGGPIPVAIRRLAKEKFFTDRLPFPNKRYRHFDMVAKFLMIENDQKIIDTKKIQLDRFAKSFESKPRSKMPPFIDRTAEELVRMDKVFVHKDPLLRQVGMVTLYYHLFRFAKNAGWKPEKITRQKLIDFNKAREKNRAVVEAGGDADNDLTEFERFAQSPNDSYALRYRLRVLLERAFKTKVKLEKL